MLYVFYCNEMEELICEDEVIEEDLMAFPSLKNNVHPIPPRIEEHIPGGSGFSFTGEDCRDGLSKAEEAASQNPRRLDPANCLWLQGMVAWTGMG